MQLCLGLSSAYVCLAQTVASDQVGMVQAEYPASDTVAVQTSDTVVNASAPTGTTTAGLSGKATETSCGASELRGPRATCCNFRAGGNKD
jgi:hypothetical protein